MYVQAWKKGDLCSWIVHHIWVLTWTRRPVTSAVIIQVCWAIYPFMAERPVKKPRVYCSFSSLYYLFLYHITAFILEYNQPHFIKYTVEMKGLILMLFLALCGFIIGYAFLFVLLFRNLRGGCLWLTIVTVNYSMLLNLISSNPRV